MLEIKNDTLCIFALQDGTFVPLFANNFVLEPPGHKLCTEIKYTKQVIFVDARGKPIVMQ